MLRAASHMCSVHTRREHGVSVLTCALGEIDRRNSFASFSQDTCSPITSQGTINPWEHTNYKEIMGLSVLVVPLVEASTPTPKGCGFIPSQAIYLSCRFGSREESGGKLIDVSLFSLSSSQNKTNKPILQRGLNNNNMGLKDRTTESL